MDQGTERRLDAIVEDDIRRGYVVKVVPARIERALADEGLPALGWVRFSRENAARRRRISEVVQRQYHRDYQNPDILSNEQLRKLALERGEWTPEKEARMDALAESTQKDMRELYLDGVNHESWLSEMLDLAELVRTSVREEDTLSEEQREALLARFDRWAEYTPDRRDWYTAQYAAEQERPQYSPDLDLDRLLSEAPSAAAGEALMQMDELRDRLYRLIKLRKDQAEMLALREAQARIFADSCESRRDAAQNLARLYFCTERVDQKGQPLGPIAPTFEALWEFPDEATSWLLEEQYFFVNGIPDEARDMLSAFGFLTADREKDEVTPAPGASEPSVASPAPPSSKDDTTRVEETVAASSVSPVGTT